jgi:hypothetical protein
MLSAFKVGYGVSIFAATYFGECPESLRVFGCLSVTGARGCTAAGVRKASREEIAGEFATAVVSIYGDLAPVLDHRREADPSRGAELLSGGRPSQLILACIDYLLSKVNARMDAPENSGADMPVHAVDNAAMVLVCTRRADY